MPLVGNTGNNVGANLEALHYLIERLYRAEERLGSLLDDTYTVGSQFLETFISPQRPEVEQEFNQLIADLREAREYNHELLSLLQRISIDMQDAISRPVYGSGNS